MIAAIMTLVGACLGVLLASCRVPRVRVVPLISSVILLVLAAVALVAIDASNFAAAIVFVLAVGASTILYSAAAWRGIFRDLPHPYAWFCFSELIHPNYLRQLHVTNRQARRSAAPEHAHGEVDARADR